MLFQYWPNAYGAGPTLKQHWVKSSCLLGWPRVAQMLVIRAPHMRWLPTWNQRWSVLSDDQCEGLTDRTVCAESIGWLIVCLVAWLTSSVSGCLFGWLAGWLAV